MKIFRSFNRNEGVKIGTGILTVIGGAVACFLPVEAAIGVAVAAPAIGGAAGKLVQFINEEDYWTSNYNFNLRTNSMKMNQCKFVGPRKALKQIIRTQRYIDRATKKYADCAKLPEKAMRGILSHIRDIQPQLDLCRVYDNRDTAVAVFPFMRTYYNEKGDKQSQVLVNVALSDTVDDQSEAQYTPVELPTLAAQKAAKAAFDAAGKGNAPDASKPDAARKLEL